MKIRRGNALILVLVVTSALTVLALVAAQLATRTSDRLREEARSTQLVNELEGAIELYRLELVRAYQTSNLSANNWIAGLPDPAKREFPAVYPDVVAWISNRSGPTGAQWLELTCSTRPGSRVRQSVRQIINFDRSSIWDLAILCETTDCMACHLNVRGDWGTLFDNFRPGHDMAGSGFGTRAAGRLYAAGNVIRAPGEAAGSRWINGAEFLDGVEENSTSSKLPVDEDTGQIALPRLKPRDIVAGIAEDMASGRTVGLGQNATTTPTAATMAEMYAIPHFKDTNGNDKPEPGEWVSFARNPDPTAGAGLAAGDPAAEAVGYRVEKIPPVWDGNLVLVGTEDRPIVLNGDVFVTGDVVIKGVVTGKGAIYAGRNTYIAGDLKYKNPPQQLLDAMRNPSGDPSEFDQAAQADLAANTDELRLAARANMVLGDYVETQAGQKLPIRDRQAADYFREQFGFTPSAADGGMRYFLPFREDPDGDGPEVAVPSIELKPDPDQPGKFRPFDWRPSDGGAPIDASDVVQLDGYETLRPSVVEKQNGAKHDWINDDAYRTVLGTQDLDLNTYRGFVPRAPVSGASGTTLPGGVEDDKRREILEQELGMPGSSAPLLGTSTSFSRWVDDWYATDPVRLAQGVRMSFDPSDPTGNGWDTNQYDQPLVTVYKKGVFDESGNLRGYTLRVLDERVQSFPDQTEVVDAFLYSNARIAGLTQAGTNLTVNGGMISGEIGVLAPGRRAVLDKSMDSWQAGDPSGETNTAGLVGERHYAWRSAEGLTTQGVGWPATPTFAPDGQSISGPIAAFDGNYSRVGLELWYQEDDAVNPAWTETIDHPTVPAQPAWTQVIEHPATPGTPATYYAQVFGGTRSVLVGTGYGVEYRTVWDPDASYWSPAFSSAAEAQAWADGQLAQPITARASSDAPEETKPRGSGWGGSSSPYNDPGSPGQPAWTETIDHPATPEQPGWTETIDHPETITPGSWRRDLSTTYTVEDYPGASGVVTETDLRAALDARLQTLNRPASRLSIAWTSREKYKRYGFQDQLNGWNWLDANTRERDAFLNRWWRGNITLADGRRTSLRAGEGSVNPLNGETYEFGAVVNYDFRMRNGGLGFDRIGDDVGKRLVWLPTGYVPPPP